MRRCRRTRALEVSAGYICCCPSDVLPDQRESPVGGIQPNCAGLANSDGVRACGELARPHGATLMRNHLRRAASVFRKAEIADDKTRNSTTAVTNFLFAPRVSHKLHRNLGYKPRGISESFRACLGDRRP